MLFMAASIILELELTCFYRQIFHKYVSIDTFAHRNSFLINFILKGMPYSDSFDLDYKPSGIQFGAQLKGKLPL